MPRLQQYTGNELQLQPRHMPMVTIFADGTHVLGPLRDRWVQEICFLLQNLW